MGTYRRCTGKDDYWKKWADSKEDCSRACHADGEMYFVVGRQKGGWYNKYKCYCEQMSNNAHPCNANGDYFDYDYEYDFYTNAPVPAP